MASAEPAGALLQIEVVYSPHAGQMRVVGLQLPPGATLNDALCRSGLLPPPLAGRAPCVAGIWGRVQALDTVLRDHDRVEIYRPLQVDPKEARRLRYKQARAKR